MPSGGQSPAVAFSTLPTPTRNSTGRRRSGGRRSREAVDEKDWASNECLDAGCTSGDLGGGDVPALCPGASHDAEAAAAASSVAAEEAWAGSERLDAAGCTRGHGGDGVAAVVRPGTSHEVEAAAVVSSIEASTAKEAANVEEEAMQLPVAEDGRATLQMEMVPAVEAELVARFTLLREREAAQEKQQRLLEEERQCSLETMEAVRESVQILQASLRAQQAAALIILVALLLLGSIGLTIHNTAHNTAHKPPEPQPVVYPHDRAYPGLCAFLSAAVIYALGKLW